MSTFKPFVFAIFFWLTATLPVLAQDPLEVAPDHYKLLFENDRVRVMQVDMQPGDTIATHSHPDHVAYLLSGGKFRLTYPDGKTKEIEEETGKTMWINAETHAAENIGDTELRILVFELK